ncbi:MAG: M3 family oligoendopeptidase [Clostridia bacterium]
MQQRKDIKLNNQWDLTKFCKDDETWEKNLEKVQKLINKIPYFEGKLGNKDKLMDYYDLEYEISKLISPLLLYVGNKHNEDLENSKYNEMSGKIDDVCNKYSVANSFFNSEMLFSKKCGEKYLKNLLIDEDFDGYKKSHQELIDNIPHTLTRDEEKIVARLNSMFGEFENIYDAASGVDLKFNDALDSRGNSHEITIASYFDFLESPDRELRKNAYLSYSEGITRLENTLSANYIASVRKDWAIAELSKYNSCLSASVDDLEISQKTYDNLIENVNRNIDINKSYLQLRKKMMGLEKMEVYDKFVPIAKYPKQKITFEEAFEMVKEALGYLGKNYTNILDRARMERWMDVYPTKNKMSGAYDWGCYGFTPAVLLNFTGNISDTLTIAHELGHAVNNVLTYKKQPESLAEVQQFLAEIASTTNEVLMLKYLINNAKTPEEKINYLNQYCSLFNGTLFSQTRLSEFEDFAHKLVEKGKPISKDILNKEFSRLDRKYSGDESIKKEESNNKWIDIGHFFRPYYVFQYATGITSAVCLASKIVNKKPDAVKNYKNFLSSGYSKKPNEILKEAGVDLESNEPYNYAFAEYKWAIKTLEKVFEENKENINLTTKISVKKRLVAQIKQNKNINNVVIMKPKKKIKKTKKVIHKEELGL